MVKLIRITPAALALCLCLGSARPAGADAVTYWNNVASTAIVAATAAGRPGPATSLDFAKVHVAIYDAIQAIVRTHRPYHVEIPGASGSPAAAAAKAARDVLVDLFPTQTGTIDTAYNDFFTANSLDPTDPGVAVGQQAAAGIINLRSGDGSFPPSFPPFTGGLGPGEWRPTTSYLPGPPPSGAPMAAPWLAAVVPYTLRFSSQFRADPPPALTSREYTKNFNEVKRLGAHDGSERTPEQTDLAYFWSENFFAQWNRALRAIAEAHILSIGDSARLFALANMATADAVITAWDTKRHFNFWRPVTAIQLADTDSNSRTVADPNWQPLINNPNYPDYTSGANNVTGAMTKALALFFGKDKMTFVVTSNAPQVVQKTRTYHRFSQAASEVVEARILLGIHFRFADTEARTQGRKVAKWAFKHHLRPLHHQDHDDDDDDDDDRHDRHDDDEDDDR